MWGFEKAARNNGFSVIAGVDEAGRGPLAGPVVSAAVILPEMIPVSGINDSKKLTPKKRETLYGHIYRHSIAVGVGIIEPSEIDRMNILQASLTAMAMSVNYLKIKPDYLLVDGPFPLPTDIAQQPIIRGDSKSISIAAASIVAKVTRDRIMEEYDRQYPEFDFAVNKGYPTKLHREAIKKFGCCPIHRRSFKGVREYV